MAKGQAVTPTVSTAPSMSESQPPESSAPNTNLPDNAGIASPLGKNARIAQTSIARSVFNHWKDVTHHPRSQLDAKRMALICARLSDGYTEDDLRLAALGCATSRWHQGENDRHQVYDSIELIYRNADKVDQFMRLGEQEVFRKERAAQSEREQAEARLAKSTVGGKYQEARGRLLSIVAKTQQRRGRVN